MHSLTGDGQGDKAVVLVKEGRGLKFYSHRLVSPFGSPMLAATLFQKMNIVASLVKEVKTEVYGEKG